MEDQRSKEWHDIRAIRFTGSEMHKLLVGGRRDMTEQELIEEKKKGGKRKTVDTEFGEVALSYIFEKACNIVFGRDESEQFVTYDMQRGITNEPLAFRKFKELKELEFIDVQECSFFSYGDNSGSSPDAIVDKDAVGELKCPKPLKFFNLILKGKSAIDFEYIVQMQTEILSTNSKRCHFFNYIIYNNKEMWHEIIVDRDDEMIELIKSKIISATKIRDELVIELQNKKQF